MEKEIQIYIGKTHADFVLCRLEGSVLTFYGSTCKVEKNVIAPSAASSIINKLLGVNEVEFRLNEVQAEYELMNHSSFADLYKKTNLITLRIEDGKIKIFNAKKVKRWYEFEPIKPTEGYGMDDEGVGKLAIQLVALLNYR